MRRFQLLALVIGVAALLVGCGDDAQDPVLEPASPSSTSTTSSTPAEAGDDGAATDDTTSDTNDTLGDDGGGEDETVATTNDAADDTVTTTSERLSPDDPDYPTTQPSPPATYPATGG